MLDVSIGQSGLAQCLNLMHKTKGTGTADFFYERGGGKIQLRMRSAIEKNRVVEIDGERINVIDMAEAGGSSWDAFLTPSSWSRSSWTTSGPIGALISRKPIHLLSNKERGEVVKLEQMWLDIGAKDKEELDLHRFVLTPAFVERHPHHNRRMVAQRAHHRG